MKAKRPHRGPVMGMCDRKLADWLKRLEPEERARVLIGVALGWKQLSARRKEKPTT